MESKVKRLVQVPRDEYLELFKVIRTWLEPRVPTSYLQLKSSSV